MRARSTLLGALEVAGKGDGIVAPRSELAPAGKDADGDAGSSVAATTVGSEPMMHHDVTISMRDDGRFIARSLRCKGRRRRWGVAAPAPPGSRRAWSRGRVGGRATDGVP